MKDEDVERVSMIGIMIVASFASIALGFFLGTGDPFYAAIALFFTIIALRIPTSMT
jgi:uncharacterized membrane protein